ncbi:MAG: 2OG-Fe(II) oxygenase family protein [Halioglobus sp.]
MMQLNAKPDLYADTYASLGRISIPNFLTPDSAAQLHNCLATQDTWNLVFTRDGAHVDIGADSLDKWSPAQRLQFDAIVHQSAERGFQYLYKNIPIYDIYHKNLLPGHLFNQLFEFLNDSEFLNFARQLTRHPEVSFCDAQATCYEAGHFLTCHDDATEGKNRIAAFVLNMTPDWNPDWGGALQFYDDQDNIEAGFKPSYNTLNVFQVPRRHAVGIVAPFAIGSRFSITGWFRSGDDPEAR